VSLEGRARDDARGNAAVVVGGEASRTGMVRRGRGAWGAAWDGRRTQRRRSSTTYGARSASGSRVRITGSRRTRGSGGRKKQEGIWTVGAESRGPSLQRVFFGRGDFGTIIGILIASPSTKANSLLRALRAAGTRAAKIWGRPFHVRPQARRAGEDPSADEPAPTRY